MREVGRYKTVQQVSTHRHSAGANSARPKRGVRHKYGILAPEGSVGDISTVGTLGSRYDPEELDTVDTKDMETGNPYRQSVPPAHGQLEEEGGGP